MKVKPVELKVTVTTNEGSINEANYVMPITVHVETVPEKPEEPEKRKGFRAWDPDIEDDGRTILRLAESDDGDGGSVTLVAVDVDGEMIQAGRLLSISPDGYLERRQSVNESIPIQQNHGQIVEYGKKED